jgi:hypothetical protein
MVLLLQVFEEECVQAGGLCQITFLNPEADSYENTTHMIKGLALVRKNDPIVFMEVGSERCGLVRLVTTRPAGASSARCALVVAGARPQAPLPARSLSAACCPPTCRWTPPGRPASRTSLASPSPSCRAPWCTAPRSRPSSR